MNIRDVNEVDKYLQENTFKLEEENIVVGTFSAAEVIVKSVNDLLLHDVRLSFDEVKRLLYLAVKNSEKSKDVEGIYYSNDLKELDEYESLVKKYLGNEA